MKESLTQRNGIVCRSCFKTIDLTTLEWKRFRHLSNPYENMYGTSELSIKCPFCNQITRHSRKEIKPIIDKNETEQKFQKIDKLRKENNKLILSLENEKKKSYMLEGRLQEYRRRYEADEPDTFTSEVTEDESS